MPVTGYPNPRDWERQFLDNGDWHICELSNLAQTARENMVRIVQAEAWMHEHCEPDSAYRFGSKFYFKHQEDHVKFTLTWS